MERSNKRMNRCTRSNKQRFTYDVLNQQTGITDALGATTSFTYDEVGNAIALTDALVPALQK